MRVCDLVPSRWLRHDYRIHPGKSGSYAHHQRHPGFSLIELLVVLAVTVILTGLMLPALSQVRDNVDRVLSASQMRQIGMGLTMYIGDEKEKLPYSFLLSKGLPMELMAAHVGDGPNSWDGLGLLYIGGYLSNPECFYCPSNEGEHSFDKYEYEWVDPSKTRIYTNYHYCGHADWEEPARLRRIDDGDRLILLTDGFRTKRDLNHDSGINILRGDNSVRWREMTDRFVSQLPPEGLQDDQDQGEYRWLWREIEGL